MRTAKRGSLRRWRPGTAVGVLVLGLAGPAGLLSTGPGAGAAVPAAGPAQTAKEALSVVGTVAVGDLPEGVAVDPTTHVAYVADQNSGSVDEISGTTVSATVPTGGAPAGVAVDPGSHVAYVIDNGSDLAEISGTTVTAHVALPGPDFTPAVDPTTHLAYVPDFTNDTVSEVSGSSVVATVPVGSYPDSVAVDPGTHVAYVTNNGDGTVSEVVGSRVTATVTVGSGPGAVAVDPGTHVAYVANASSDTVSEISGATVVATVDLGQPPSAIAVDPTTHLVYVAYNAGRDGDVSEIRGGAVVATVHVGTSPSSIAVDPGAHLAYVSDDGLNEVTEVRVPAPPKHDEAYGYAAVVDGSVAAHIQANSTGAKDTAVVNGTGSYTVTFPGLAQGGANGGTASLENGEANVNCDITDWNRDAQTGNLTVSVACFATDGSPVADNSFVVTFGDAPANGPQSDLAYVYADQPSASAYTPPSNFSYDSAGGTDTITRVSTGVYSVSTPGLSLSNGTANVSGVDLDGGPGDAYCQLDGWGAGAVHVLCFGPSGSPLDAPFTMTWTAGGSQLGVPGHGFGYLWANDPGSTAPYTPASNYAADASGGAITVSPVSTGVFDVEIAGAGQTHPGTALVTPYGSAFVQCVLGPVDDLPGNELFVQVACTIPPEGIPLNTEFTLQFMR